MQVFRQCPRYSSNGGRDGSSSITAVAQSIIRWHDHSVLRLSYAGCFCWICCWGMLTGSLVKRWGGVATPTISCTATVGLYRHVSNHTHNEHSVYIYPAHVCIMCKNAFDPVCISAASYLPCISLLTGTCIDCCSSLAGKSIHAALVIVHVKHCFVQGKD